MRVRLPPSALIPKGLSATANVTARDGLGKKSSQKLSTLFTAWPARPGLRASVARRRQSRVTHQFFWMEAKLGLSADVHRFAGEVHVAAFEMKQFAWAQSGVGTEHDVL